MRTYSKASEPNFTRSRVGSCGASGKEPDIDQLFADRLVNGCRFIQLRLNTSAAAPARPARLPYSIRI
jgi:hypothetical protein